MDNKKKILIVSNGFYPEKSPRSYRATELVKEFNKKGHDVTVITKYRDHDYSAFLKEYPVNFSMWRKNNFSRLREFNKEPLRFIFRSLSRLLSVLFEYPDIEEMFIVKKRLRKENGYDLMISFAVPYPVQWGVAWARKKNNRIATTWIADCGDPYMGDVLDTFRKPFYFKYLEKGFGRRADYITIPVESALPAYYPEFHEKIRIIPQGFDFDLTNSNNREVKNEIPEFAYAGGFIPVKRDPRKFLQALAEMDIPFRFYVYTNQKEYLNDFTEVLNDKLIISGYIPRDELLQKLSGMDFLVNFDNNTMRNIPSKLIDYIITGRPVLNISNEFNAEEVKSFLNRDYTAQMQLPDPEVYHISKVSGQFLDLAK